MIVERLELVDFRNYAHASLPLTAGTTVIVGDNGQGKTNVAEALAYLATLSSFRGAPPEALVRVGAGSAVVRAELVDEDGRSSLMATPRCPGATLGAEMRESISPYIRSTRTTSRHSTTIPGSSNAWESLGRDGRWCCRSAVCPERRTCRPSSKRSGACLWRFRSTPRARGCRGRPGAGTGPARA